MVGAVFIAALTGYAWMGEGGATAFALAGLWGCYASPRPWGIGRAGLLLLLAGMMVVPGSLWAAGLYRPDFADAIYGALEPCLARLLEFTLADELAHAALAATGDMHFWPAMRLGVAMCWLCALPMAAALVLWFNDAPSRGSSPSCRAEHVKMLLMTGGTLLLTSALVTFPTRRGMTPVFGAVAYPGLFCLWLLSIAGLRTWVRWSTASAAEQAPTP